MSETHIPYFEDEDSKPHPDMPTVERETINAVLWNPEKKEALCLDWEKFGWKTFIIGGVEEGEDIIQSAVREIEEETGYTHVEFVSELGKLKSAYYAAHKRQNRIAHTTALLFVLNDSVQKIIDTSDLPHVFKWVSADEVDGFVTLSSQKYIWSKAKEVLFKKPQ